jgi:hypothetical protein
VISLKKIPQDDGAAEETLLRIVRLLLQGIEQHAIEGDPEDVHGFRTGIQRLTDSLEGDLTVSELLVQAGSLLPTLQDYNRRTTRFLKRPAGEWQAAVIMLISALTAMQPAEGPRVSQLREIAGRVRAASGPEEAHKIRLQLSECLISLQLDNRRHRDPDPPVPSPSPAGRQLTGRERTCRGTRYSIASRRGSGRRLANRSAFLCRRNDDRSFADLQYAIRPFCRR